MSRSVIKTRVVLKLVRDMLAINNLELDFVKLVSINSIDKLPAPDDDFIKTTLPAILITCNSVSNTDVDNSKGIIYSRYCIDIKYVRHFNDEEENSINEIFYDETDKIVDFLLDDNGLDRYNLTTGEILYYAVPSINYETDETEFFKDAKIPILVSNIEFDIHFRTYKKGVIVP